MKRILLLLLLLSSASLWAQNSAVGPISITSTQCATIPVGDKGSTIGISVTGTWSGTLQPEVQIQNQPWTNTQVTPSTSTTAQSTITANGNYVASASGYDQFQLCGNTVGSGTATVYIIIKTTTSKAIGGGASGVTSVGGQTGVVAGIGTGTSVEMTSDGSQTSGNVLSANAGGAHDSGIAAANVVLASSPGAGVAHFAGSTQTATSSPVVGSDMGAAISMGQTTSTLINTTRLTSNYTSSNGNATTLFTIPLAGSTAATYWIDCYGTYSQATTATSQQLSFQSVTTGATEVDASNLVSTALSTIRTGANNLASPGTANTNFGASFTLGATGNIQPWQAHIVVTQPSGTASNFTINWLSTTGGTDVTTVYENSHCTWATTAN